MRFSGPYIVDSKIDRYIKLVAGLDLDNRRHSYYRESIQRVLDIFSLPVPSHDFMDYASKNILGLILSGRDESTVFVYAYRKEIGTVR